MNILYVTPYVPSLIRARPYNLIRALRRTGHRIALLAAAGTSSAEQEQADTFRSLGIRVEIFPVPLWHSLTNCLRALRTGEPLQAAYTYDRTMQRRLVDLLREDVFDVCHVEHLRAAWLVRSIEGVPTVYDSVDCISLLFKQAARDGAQLRHRLMTGIDLARTRRHEAWLLAKFDRAVATSWRDKQALEELAHRYLPSEVRAAPITVVTNGVDLEYFRPPESSKRRDEGTIIFTGKMSYHANVAAALYFARRVLPHIRQKNASVRLQIVGKDPPRAIRQLAADEHIEVTGTVDDLRPYLARAAVAVCPVRYAVGVQFKVLEAMAMGTPVVSTPASCAGLAAKEGEEILIADGAQELAQAVLQVLSTPDLAHRLSVAGRRYVESHHSWDAAAQVLLGVYEQVCGDHTAPTAAL